MELQDMETMSSNKEDAVEVEEEGPLPGFRFHPTDEELVTFYLRRKVENKPISIEIIKEIDIYKHDPWELTRAVSSTGDKVWYFYCKRGRKYKNSIRPNRVAGSGFWKATGIDKQIYSNGGGCIGLKKSLVFYRGSAGKGTKTDWMMHEFRLPSEQQHSCSKPRDTLQEAEIWTLCRILKRNRRHSPDWREISANKRSTEHASSSKPVDNKERFISFVNQTTKHRQQQQYYETENHKNNDPNSASIARQNEKRIICLPGGSSSMPTEIHGRHPEAAMAQTAFASSGDEGGEQFLGGNSWEDLSSVVEFATRAPFS